MKTTTTASVRPRCSILPAATAPGRHLLRLFFGGLSEARRRQRASPPCRIRAVPRRPRRTAHGGVPDVRACDHAGGPGHQTGGRRPRRLGRQLAALSLLVVALQVMSRQLRRHAGETATLRALGADPTTATADAVTGIVGAVAVGGAMAVGVAVALSPLFPFGPGSPRLPRGCSVRSSRSDDRVRRHIRRPRRSGRGHGVPPRPWPAGPPRPEHPPSPSRHTARHVERPAGCGRHRGPLRPRARGGRPRCRCARPSWVRARGPRGLEHGGASARA